MPDSQIKSKKKIISAIMLLAFYPSYSTFSFAAPELIDINGTNDIINTPQSNEKLFNITNNGSLTVAGVAAGLDSVTSQAHQLTDSTLSIKNGATFTGSIQSSNSNINIINSTFKGNIGSTDNNGSGDVFINASVINGTLRSGTGNQGKEIYIKDSTLNGPANFSALFVQSGKVIVSDSKLSSQNFATVDIRNVESTVINNVDIENINTNPGSSAIGASGVYLQNSSSSIILDSVINSDGTAVRTINDNKDNPNKNLIILNSALTGVSGAALEATNSDIIIANSTFSSVSNGDGKACMNYASAQNGCGAVNVKGSRIRFEENSEIVSNNVGIMIGGEENTDLAFIDSFIHAEKAALSLNNSNSIISLENNTIPVTGSSSITSNNGILLEALNNSHTSVSMDNINATGDIIADSTSSINFLLGGYSYLQGDMQGVNSVEIQRNAIWKMNNDNSIGDMLLSGGTISFPDSPNAKDFHSLNFSSLSGMGTFKMNTNLQTMQGDSLNIAGEANGIFTLSIANSGSEPDDENARLQVVQAGGGSALFSLVGDKVDVGVWEYGLVREGDQWFLSQEVYDDDNAVPGDDNAVPGDDNAAPGDDNDPSDDNDPDHSPVPEKVTTPSADAILSMASAPLFIFNNELQNLRQRRGNLLSDAQHEGGVWGRYLHSTSRITTAMKAAYTLEQNGFELGGDKAVQVARGNLSIGAVTSITNNTIKHARGGNSQIDSYSVGLYASWFDDSGLYMDGVIKANRFNNELNTRMSDGTPVHGSYNQNGFGGALETGWHLSFSDSYWIEPFARVSIFQASSKNVALSNSMTGRIHHPRSLQGETGMHFGKKIQFDKTEFNPYVKVSVAREFARNNGVQLNKRWEFNDAVSGQSARYGAGATISLSKETSLFAEINYQQGRHIESPVSGNLGFHFSF